MSHRRSSTVAQMFRSVKEASQATALLLQATDQQIRRSGGNASSVGGGAPNPDGPAGGHEVRREDHGPASAGKVPRFSPAASSRRRTTNDIVDAPLRGSPLREVTSVEVSPRERRDAAVPCTPPRLLPGVGFDSHPHGRYGGSPSLSQEKDGRSRGNPRSAFSTAIPAALRASGLVPEAEDISARPDLAFIQVGSGTGR